KVLTSEAAHALIVDHDGEALKLADRAIAEDPRNPWGHYRRAVALASLHRFDEAVASFTDAELRFAAADRWGWSIAIYGRARALAEAGRCGDAKRAFQEYVAL